MKPIKLSVARRQEVQHEIQSPVAEKIRQNCEPTRTAKGMESPANLREPSGTAAEIEEEVA